MPLPRPFGIGPYGSGLYSRYAGTIWDVGGATQLLFGAQGKLVKIIRPWAITQIVWDVWAEHLNPTWMLPPPCEPGEWQPAAPCEVGGWGTPPGCAAGVWTPVRLPG